MIPLSISLILLFIAVGAAYYLYKEKFAFKSIRFSETMPSIAFISCNQSAPSFPSIDLSNFEIKLLPVYRYCYNVINYNSSESIDETLFKTITKSDPYIIRVMNGICSSNKYSSSNFSKSFKSIVQKYNLISSWGENGCRVQTKVVDPLTKATKIVYTLIDKVPDYDFYNYIVNGNVINFYLYLADKFNNSDKLLFGAVAKNRYFM